MRTLFLSLLLITFAAACSTTKATAGGKGKAPEKTYAGTWMVTVEDTPLGTVKGEMTLTETEEGLTGVYVSEGRTFKLSDVVVGEGTLTSVFYYSDYGVDVDVSLKGAPTDDTLIGSSMGEYRTTAVRKVEE